MKNLKISQKIIVGFIIVALLTGVVGLVGATNLKYLANNDKRLYENHAVPLGNLVVLTTDVYTLRIYSTKLAIADIASRQRLLVKIEEVKKDIENVCKLIDSAADPEDKATFKQFDDALDQYYQYLDQEQSLLNQGNSAQAMAMIQSGTDFSNTGEELGEALKKIEESFKSGAQESAQLNAKKSSDITLLMIIIAFAAILLALGQGVYISRLISRPIIAIKDASNRLAEGDLSVRVDYRSKDEIGQVVKAFGLVVENISHLITELKRLTESVTEGDLDKRAQDNGFKGSFKELIDGVNSIMNTFVKHIDSIPMPIAIMDTGLKVKFINKAGADVAGITKEESKKQHCYDLFKAGDCNKESCACMRAIKEGESITNETEAHPNGLNLDISYTGTPIMDGDNKIIGVMETVQDLTSIKEAQKEAQRQTDIIKSTMDTTQKQAEYQKNEVEKLIQNINQLAEGNLDIQISLSEPDEDTLEIAGSFKQINDSLKKSTEEIKSYINELAHVLGQMADKNFTVGIDREYLGDFTRIKDSTNYILEQFNTILAEINTAAEQVGSGADQVASTSQNLSYGASQQASAIEEISATVAEVAEQVKQNAVSANQANELSQKAQNDATAGSGQMIEMVSAMNAIKESSKQIASVIKVIDDIAFQTNILALNAAVEAARAGEHGKGFAVVAEEVRRLAARSANAAKETTEMIENSIEKIEEGSAIANETSEAFNKIVSGVTDTGEIVGKIATASVRQAEAISQIDSGVNQISQVTQTNTATAEESASSSEEMAAQAQMLEKLIRQFKLKNAEKKEAPFKAELLNKSHITKIGIPGEIEISLDDANFGKY